MHATAHGGPDNSGLVEPDESGDRRQLYSEHFLSDGNAFSVDWTGKLAAVKSRDETRLCKNQSHVHTLANMTPATRPS